MLKKLILCMVMIFLTLPVSAQDAPVLTVITHDSFTVSEDVIALFEAETGVRVQFLKAGDAGTMVNQSILSRENPLGDVIYGVDNTFLSRALEADLFIPYESPLLENVPEAFLADETSRVTPIDYGDVCLNYDVSYFEDNSMAVPDSFAALTDPAYRSLLVVENPATSSPGLAFLLATVAAFGIEGDETYLDFWAALVENDVLVVDDWNTAYYSEFSGSSGEGDRPLVVSYASSPPAEVFFADPPIDSALTESITANGMCFRQIEYAGILEGTDNEEAAQQFIDFLLSKPFQEDIPLQMFVFPVNQEAELPNVFVEYAAVPENPAIVDFAAIEAGRDEWIESWTDIVLR